MPAPVAGRSSDPWRRQTDRTGLELGPFVAVAADQREPHHVAIEGHRRVHVTRPVVDVVDRADQRSALTQDLRLLGLELVLGEDASGAKVGEPLELGRGRWDIGAARGGTDGAETGVAVS